MILNGQATGAFSTTTELELWQEIRPGEEERHEALLDLLGRVPLDGAIARRAGELRRRMGLGNLPVTNGAELSVEKRDNGNGFTVQNYRFNFVAFATLMD